SRSLSLPSASTVHRIAVLNAGASGVGHDDGPVVRGDAVEVTVGDRHQRFAGQAHFLGHNPGGRRIRGELLRLEEIAGGLGSRGGSVQPGIAFVDDVPFSFGDLLVLNSNAHRDDRRTFAFLNDAKVSRLTADRIEITALKFPEASNALPC